MVILGFMFNYMLRVNLTIAIVDMVVDVNRTKNSTTPGPKFEWDKFQVNDALGSFFWGYILTELPGKGKIGVIVTGEKQYGGFKMVNNYAVVVFLSSNFIFAKFSMANIRWLQHVCRA